MNRLLVLMETDGSHIQSTSIAAVSFAAELAVPFDILIAGGPSIDAEAEAWKSYGADRIFVASSEALAQPTDEGLASICAQLMDSGTSLIGRSTMSDILARVSGALDLPMVNDVRVIVRFVCSVNGQEPTVEQQSDRPRFHSISEGGRVEQLVTIDAPRVVISIRGPDRRARFPEESYCGEQTTSRSGPSRIEKIEIRDLPQSTRVIAQTTAVHKRPPLNEARVIIAGGRSLGESGAFEQYLGKIADKLGGAIAASGGAVHSGIAPADKLVGQTGQTVAPELYIAVGISGADQHIGGMQNSRVIVAVNRDPHASIFRVADYGLVADFRDALPELAEKL